jgi:mycothione reductase
MAAKRYDLIVIGTGSAMNLVDPFLRSKPGARVAVIDKDEPGGICLTRGCIPTKLLVSVADVVRHVESAGDFGIDVTVNKIDFPKIMKRMRDHIDPDIESIRKGLSKSPDIDYYHKPAKFVAPKTLEVDGKKIQGETILLCTGSKVLLPPIQGLDKVPYLTSDTVLDLKVRPESLVIVGGGYIAAEFAHFFSAIGTRVTMLGRNERLLPDEEPEVSRLALTQMRRHMRIETGVEVHAVKGVGKKGVRVTGRTKKGAPLEVDAEQILIAAGRSSTSDILAADKGGVRTDKAGWIVVDEFLRTSAPGVWAMGDANGVHQFKHKANYESLVVWQNAFGGQSVKVDYHAVPRAVFTHPEIASVGMGEAEAIRRYGKDLLRIGLCKYEETAKGQAIGAKDHFVKVLVQGRQQQILGAHIIGPQASVLIHEIIPLMNTPERSAHPIRDMMHIHPALSEVVERAVGQVHTVDEYHALLREAGLE